MDVGSSFIADGKAPELGEPCEGALGHPAMTAQPFTALDAAPGDAVANATLAQGVAAAPCEIIGFVGVQDRRAPPRASPTLVDGRHGIDHLLEHHRVVEIGSRHSGGERDAAVVDQDVALGARLSGCETSFALATVARALAGAMGSGGLKRGLPSEGASARCACTM